MIAYVSTQTYAHMKMDAYKSATIFLIIFVVVLFVIFGILVGVGYIHLGKLTVPIPSIKQRCGDYAQNKCEGSQTTSNQLCVLQNGICTEYVAPGPPPIPKLTGDEIGVWFLANPTVPVTFSIPAGTTAIVNPNTFTYIITYNGIDQRGLPTLTVTAQRQPSDAITPDIHFQTVLGFTETMGYTEVVPDRRSLGIGRVSVQQTPLSGQNVMNVSVTSTNQVPFVEVTHDFGVYRQDRNGIKATMSPLPPSIRPMTYIRS